MVKGKIDLVISELAKIGNVIDSLANAQNTLADSLRIELRTLNMTFMNNIATAVFGADQASSYMSKITTAARIPGVMTLLCEEREGAVGEEFGAKMSDLIAEDVGFVTATDNTPLFVCGVLGDIVPLENICCENESDTVIIRTDEKDIRLFNRLRLLEQIVPYKIGG